MGGKDVEFRTLQVLTAYFSGLMFAKLTPDITV